MTFYAETAKSLDDLATTLRQDLPTVYGSILGFRGLLVLKQKGSNHVIALTLWEGEEAMKTSEPHAQRYAEQIRAATGMGVTRNVYEVLGSINVGNV